MSSQKNNDTSYPPSEPKPCANNCGFFGTPENLNLCSQCYMELCIEEEFEDLDSIYGNVVMALPAPKPSSPVMGLVGPSTSSKPVNRCSICNKKVGLTGFVCKCGSTFCGTHRYPEEHQCSYDFKAAGKEEISQANPVVKSDKVKRI
ncbi:zinc finger A20 and AN1 domain-containing stress-associated protein 7 [Cajanus cajan]|uniref:Zinc finger A20 and AN1 domain-containing stress-associated protein 7 n=1 Tax=Cajanus cajan TaxID=3821 RepID=A0A151SNK1_CAJCA|nr:zinc finger A20 and AN1 domain-containing stress-associated protein 7 [Cajanus cajan]KYP56420.1 Zinc finger A20 and AN1 domain-containing stress-associated protein 7 [Cajanus cajan]